MQWINFLSDPTYRLTGYEWHPIYRWLCGSINLLTDPREYPDWPTSCASEYHRLDSGHVEDG